MHYFHGMQVSYIANGLCLSHQKDILDLLSSTGLENSKPMNVPIVIGKQFNNLEGVPLVDPIKNRKLVGSLQYLTLTRPDVGFGINKLCQFMASPTKLH